MINKNKFLFAVILLVQVWVILGAFFSLSLIFIILSLFFGLVSYYRPLQALYILLVGMVLFGSRPPEIQTHYLIILSAFWLLGAYGQLLIAKGSKLKYFMVKLRSGNIVHFFSTFFMFVSLLSLIGLPVLGAVKHSVQEDWLYIFKEILPVGELTLFYSVQSVFFLIQGYAIGLYVYGITKFSNQLKIFKNVLFALFAGWGLFILFGYLDFFGLFDLTKYRYVDGISISRLTSFFPNSSWSAQYLAITLPLLPVVLLVNELKKYTVIIMVLLIVIGEVALILSMQRGAWMTYPPTLLMIWVTIYYVIAKRKKSTLRFKEFLKKNWIKIFVTIPLTIIISVTLVYEIKDYRRTHHIKSATDTFADITNRANKVTDNSNRKIHWPPAIKLFLENPIYGGGGDSFGWQYKEYFYKPEARYHNTPEHTLTLGQFGTAHNLYLQTLTGKGIFGLLFLLSFLIVLVYKLVQKEFSAKRSLNLESSIMILIVLGSLSATMIYGNVQEIFYTQPVAIVFWIMIFIGTGLVHEYTLPKLKRESLWHFGKYLFYFMLILLPFHIMNISYIRDYISCKLAELLPMIGLDASSYIVVTGLWLCVAVIAISFWMHKKVIVHTHDIGFFIDDHSGETKSHAFHSEATPRAGGIGIFIANLFLVFNPIGWKFLVAALPAFIVGLFDDFSPLTPRSRLFLQGLSAFLAIVLLNALIDSMGFGLHVNYLIGVVLTIVAITGSINAINMIDGFNGLAAGAVGMMLVSMLFISYWVGDMELFEILIINIAAIVGFMTLNFPKGKIFLGDGGAYFLGFLVATVSLMLSFRNEEISQWYPLALLIYPVFEVMFSIYRRKIFKSVKMTHPDRIHLHQLIYKRITKNNPMTSVFLWKRLLPFMIVTTLFYQSDIAMIGVVIVFALYYIRLYNDIVRFKKFKISNVKN